MSFLHTSANHCIFEISCRINYAKFYSLPNKQTNMCLSFGTGRQKPIRSCITVLGTSRLFLERRTHRDSCKERGIQTFLPSLTTYSLKHEWVLFQEWRQPGEAGGGGCNFKQCFSAGRFFKIAFFFQNCRVCLREPESEMLGKKTACSLFEERPSLC